MTTELDQLRSEAQENQNEVNIMKENIKIAQANEESKRIEFDEMRKQISDYRNMQLEHEQQMMTTSEEVINLTKELEEARDNYHKEAKIVQVETSKIIESPDFL